MSTRFPWDPAAPTPFDGQPWPTRLDARVVEGNRIHGYDAVGDLGRHYRFAEVVLLSLTGALPSPEAGQAFELALTSLAPTSVAEAPGHAAVLARVCSGSTSAVLACAALALAEQARWEVAAHSEWLASLDAPRPASVPLSADADVVAISEALTAIGFRAAAVEHAKTRVEAALAIFRACGLVRTDQLETAWMVARLPVVAAEAFAAPLGDFKGYPLNVPAFTYSEEAE